MYIGKVYKNIIEKCKLEAHLILTTNKKIQKNELELLDNYLKCNVTNPNYFILYSITVTNTTENIEIRLDCKYWRFLKIGSVQLMGKWYFNEHNICY